MHRPLPFVVGLVVLTSAGCGTLVNLSRLPGHDGGMQPYGGVAFDLDTAAEKHDAALKDPPRRNFENIHGNQSALLLADTPFSLIGDTLTLPLALLAEQRREQGAERQLRRPSEPPSLVPDPPPPTLPPGTTPIAP